MFQKILLHLLSNCINLTIIFVCTFILGNFLCVSTFFHIYCCRMSWPSILLNVSIFTATTLTGCHFLVTALVGAVSNATGLSASKHVPLWELLWFSIVANMSITGMNFSLMLNSVGFYQVKILLKLSCCIFDIKLHDCILCFLILSNLVLDKIQLL